MHKSYVVSLCLTFLSVCNIFAGNKLITDMQTEYLDMPLGIDTEHPRFTWRLASGSSFMPVSYEVFVATDSVKIESGVLDKDVHVISGPQGNGLLRLPVVLTADGVLKPMTKYYWRVVMSDADGEKLESDVASFETGKMKDGKWFGNWISDGKGKDFLPAPYFRKEFDLADKPVKSARVYIAAAGIYDLRVNGNAVGDHFLDPLYTRYDRRNLYVTHDVTDLLNSGRNAIGVVLGNGFYNHQSLAVWNFENAPWRNRPAFCLDLIVEYEDGSKTIVPTDLSWRTSTGEVVRNNIYTGEHRDFNKCQFGWDKAGFDDSSWVGVGLRGAPSKNVTAQQARPIRIDRLYRPESVNHISDSVAIYDFGQNMSGVTRLKLRGQKGDIVKIRHGERLNPDGSLDQSNIDVYYRGDRSKYPFQTDIVTLSGGDDHYTASFGYKGFRYVEVTAPESSDVDIVAAFVHSDVPSVGEIKASEPIIEKLVHASRMSYLSNLMGLPTDCPQREKNGWTGDGHLAIEAGLYNFDGITIYEKWLADHRDEQQPNGVLPDIIPTGGWGYGTDNGLDWTSTIAIIPWTLYEFYGDSTPLYDNYDAIRRYVDYVDGSSPDHLTSWGRGDWVPVSVGSDKEYTSSIYFYVDARILAKAARMFGYDADAEKYEVLAENIKSAINHKFLDCENGVYAGGTRTELSMALYWGIVPEECRQAVASKLNNLVVSDDYHLNVGVLGCKALLNALSENGYAETAYRVAVQDSYPSWGWWIKNGATTLLENWDLDAERDISDNHMMFGESGAWFYKGLGGIYPDPEDPGFRHVILRPFMPKDLKSFSARHRSPYGDIESSWTTKGRKIVYTAIVPPLTTATLTLPDGSVREISSGKHSFEIRR